MPNFEKHLEASRFANSEISEKKNNETPPPSAENEKKPEVSEAKPQNSAETKNETHSASYLEAQRKMASETGKFYNSLLDAYLGAKTSEEQRARIDSLIESLPAPMKKLYGEGINRMQAELVKNQLLLEEHRGDEVRYLLNIAFKDEFLQKVDITKAKYIEPSPGIAIIQLEKGFFPDSIQANYPDICFPKLDSTQPSFILAGGHPDSFTKNPDSLLEDKLIRHEVHHLVWGLLEWQGDFLREGKESSPEATAAFKKFRDEMAGYIMSHHPIIIERMGAERFIREIHEKNFSTLVNDAKGFAALCMTIGITKQVSEQDFLYPTMISRSFEEFKDNFTAIAPLEKIDRGELVVLYGIWHKFLRGAPRPEIKELLERKGLIVPANLLEKIWLNEIISADKSLLQKMLYESGFFDDLKGFFSDLGLEEKRVSDLHSMLWCAARIRHSRYPEKQEDLDLETNLGKESSKTIEECLQSLITLQGIEKSNRGFYQIIVNSSSTMKAAFDKVQASLIEKGSDFYVAEIKKADSAEKTKMLSAEFSEKLKLFSEILLNK